MRIMEVSWDSPEWFTVRSGKQQALSSEGMHCSLRFLLEVIQEKAEQSQPTQFIN